MNNYKVFKWEDVLTIKNGKDQKKVLNSNGQYPVYGSGGIIGYADDFICKEGTTIIGRKGSINNPIFVNEKFWNVDTAFGLCPGPMIDSKYLFYFCTTYNFLKHNKATTLPSLTKNDLLKIQIPLPPLEIQEKIVAILDAADEYRQKTRALIEKYDQLAQSLFLEMFGDPVRNEKGWEVKTIEKFVLKVKGAIKRGPFGGALKKEIFVESGYLVYEQFHALNNDFSFERYFIDEKKFQELKDFEVKSGDIIISCSGVYLGKLAIVPKKAKKGIINQALLKISLDQTKMRNEFFQFHFTHKNFKKKYFDSNRGAGIPNFPPMEDFKQFHFINTPIDLQNKFVEDLLLIDIQKQQVKASLQKAEELFNSLLQRAFKGELVR